MRASSSAMRLPFKDIACDLITSRLDRNHASLDSRGVGPDAVMLIGRPRDGARLEVHCPRMQRTDDIVAGDDAVAERPALVGALVVDSEKTIAKVEDRNLSVADQRRAAFARRNAVAG